VQVQGPWDFEPEYVDGSAIDEHFYFCAELHRHVAGFLAIEHPRGGYADLTVSVDNVGPIAYQAAGQNKLKGCEDGRHRMPDGQCCERF